MSIGGMASGAIGNAVVQLVLDRKNYDKEMSGIESDAEKSTSTISNAFDKIGPKGALAFGAVGAGALAAGKVLFDIGKQFDDAGDTIRATTGKTGDALDGLTKDFKEVFKSVPTDAATASNAVALLNQRLGTTGQPLQDLSKQFINLSRVAGTDLNTAIASGTRVFGDWSISADKQGQSLDYLFKVSQNTGIGVDTLMQKVVQFGGPLRQMGFGFEESAALMGKWEKEGVNADLVLGSLRIALGKFATEGVTDTHGALLKVIDDIKNAGSVGEATALAMETFGAKAGPDMAAAVLEGRFAVEDLMQMIGDSSETINTAAEDTDGFSEKWKVFKNNAMVALEPIASAVFGLGDVIFKILTPAMSGIISIATMLSNAFGGGGLTGSFNLFDGALAKVSDAFSVKLGPSIDALKQAFTSIEPVLSPLAKILGEVLLFAVSSLATTLGTSFVTGINVAAGVIQVFSGTIQLIADIVTGVVTIVKALLTGDWAGAWNAAKDLVSNTVGNITQIIGGLRDIVTGIIGGLVTSIKDFFQGIYDFLVGGSLIPDLVDSIKDLFTGLKDAIFGIFTTIYDTALSIWTNIKTIVTTLVTEAKDIVIGVVTTLRDLVSALWDEMYIKANAIWNTIKTIVTTLVTETKDTIVRLITEAKDLIAGIWDEVFTKADTIWTTIKTTVSGLVDEIKTKLTDTIKEAKDTIAGYWDEVSKKAKETWDAIKKHIEDGKQAMKDAIMWPFEQARNAIGGVAGAIKSNIAGPFNAVASGITNFASGIARVVNWIGGKLGLGTIIGEGGLIGVPQFAKGVTNFAGGYALVGEKGPELVHLAKGSNVIPADQTTSALNASRLDSDTSGAILYGRKKGWTGIGGITDVVKSAIGGVGDLAGGILDTLKDWVSKGAKWVVDAAFNAIGVSLNLPGPFSAIGSVIWDTIKSGVVDFTTSLLDSMKSKIPAEVPAGAPAGYPGGNAILDRAFNTKGYYMYCEKFVGDVMQSLGLRYFRAASAAAHSTMQPLTPGTGPAGAIVFMPWDEFGHVAFSMGNGQLFGTLNTPSGTGVQNPMPGAAWTVNPYAKGGVSIKPNIGMLSEYGQREAVIPLDESNILTNPVQTLADFMTEHHLLPNIRGNNVSEIPLELPVLNPFTNEEIDTYLGNFVIDWLNHQYFIRRGTT